MWLTENRERSSHLHECRARVTQLLVEFPTAFQQTSQLNSNRGKIERMWLLAAPENQWAKADSPLPGCSIWQQLANGCDFRRQSLTWWASMCDLTGQNVEWLSEGMGGIGHRLDYFTRSDTELTLRVGIAVGPSNVKQTHSVITSTAAGNNVFSLENVWLNLVLTLCARARERNSRLNLIKSLPVLIAQSGNGDSVRSHPFLLTIKRSLPGPGKVYSHAKSNRFPISY